MTEDWFREKIVEEHGAIVAAMGRLEVAAERRKAQCVLSLRSRETSLFPDDVRYSLWEATMTLGPPQFWVVLSAVVPGQIVILGIYPTLPEGKTALKAAVKESRPTEPERASGR